MFYIEQISTGLLANEACTGEHDCTPTQNVADAKAFETSAEAYEAVQNFGPDWNTVQY